MNNPSFVRQVALAAGVPTYKTKRVLRAAIKLLRNSIHHGETVTLYGLGTFRVKERAEKRARDMRTGELFWINSGRKVSFKPSPAFKRAAKSS